MNRYKTLFPPAIRNIESGAYFENFFIFSVLSLIGIRVFLKLTDYPQLGGGGLHIAHMLWGGVFMLISQLLFFIYLNKGVHQLASVFAGIGFGTFIDELGKFITADNNYFYQPTFAIIYSIFVFLYIIFLFYVKRSKYTPVEYLANTLEEIREAIIHDFDEEEKRRALLWLSKSNQKDRFTRALHTLITGEKPEVLRPSLLTGTRDWIMVLYLRLTTSPWVQRLAVLFFTLQVLVSIILVASFAVLRLTFSGIIIDLTLGFFGWGLIISSALAAVLLFMGLIHFAQMQRIKAYTFFRYSLLLNIFLVTFFVFYYNELIAFLYLIITIIFLKTLEYAQSQDIKLLRQAQVKA